MAGFVISRTKTLRRIINMKRYISFILVLTLIFSFIPIHAAENQPKYDFSLEEMNNIFSANSNCFKSEELIDYNSENFNKPLGARTPIEYHIAIISNGKMITTNSSYSLKCESYSNLNTYQVWQFNEISDGVFVIRMKNDPTKCLTVDPTSNTRGMYKVNLSTYVNGNANQYWSMQFSSSGNTLVSKSDDSRITGTKLYLYSDTLFYVSDFYYTRMGFFDVNQWVPTTSIYMNDFSISLLGAQYFYPQFTGPNGESIGDYGKIWNTYTVMDGSTDVVTLDGNFVQSTGTGIKRIQIRNKVTGATGYGIITAGSVTKERSTPIVKQAKSNWCWAACSEMVGKALYPSSDKDQYAIVKKIKGATLNPYPNVMGDYLDVINALSWVTNYNYSFNAEEPWTEGRLAMYFDKGNGPIVAMLGNVSTLSDGHMVVISGYKATVDGLMVYVIDPWEGEKSLMYYSQIATCTEDDLYDELIGLIYAS